MLLLNNKPYCSGFLGDLRIKVLSDSFVGLVQRIIITFTCEKADESIAIIPGVEDLHGIT